MMKNKNKVKELYESMEWDKEEMDLESFEWLLKNGFFGIGWIE